MDLAQLGRRVWKHKWGRSNSRGLNNQLIHLCHYHHCHHIEFLELFDNDLQNILAHKHNATFDL